MLKGTGFSARVTPQNVIIVIAAARKGEEKHDMSPKTKKRLLAGAAAIAAPLAGSGAAGAQDTQASQGAEEREGFELDSIVVTARRREESLADAPLSVTAVTGNLLEEVGANDLTDVADLAPNLSFSTTGTVSGSTSAAVVYIRGIGQNDYVPVVDPGVGVYVDDIYYGRVVGSVLDLADIKRVEVLRGPQGTLFGRNTIGGAINVITNDPTGDSSGRLRLIGGDDERKEAFLTANVAFSDTLNGSVNFMRRIRAGTVERVNVRNSEKLGNENSTGARAKLVWEPSGGFSLKLAADYVREREESAPEVNAFFRDSATLPGAYNGFNGFTPFAPTSLAEGCVAGDPTVGTNCYNESQQLGPFATGETSESRNDIDTWGISAVADLEISEALSAKLILGYRDLEAFFARQVDGSPLNVFENRDAFFADQTSADFRLNYKDGGLTVVAGAFYFTESSDNQLDFTGALEGTLYPIHFGGVTDNRNYSFYGEATYDVTDWLHVTGGLRYTNEEKSATPNAFGYPGCSIELLPLAPLDECDAVNPPAQIPLRTTSDYLVPNVEQTISFDKVTWRVNVSADLTDELLVYATASTGFKSGGFEWRVTDTNFRTNAINNAVASGLTPEEAAAFVEQNGALPSFRPESVLTYEVGAKLELPSAGLRFNAAVFDSKYTDQIVAANAGGIATFQTNAAESSIRGFEVEAQWVPTDALLFNFSVGHLDAKYDSLTPGALAAGLSLDDKFILTPEWSVTAGLSYNIYLAKGVLTPRVDFTHKSSQEFEAVNTIFTRDEGFEKFDLGIRYKPDNADWVLGAGVNNVTDALYKVGGDANSAIGYENVIFARPRNWFLSFDYNW